MSNNEIPTGGDRQVPVETYKCSQCNFYTNHEYYLQQHNLTHGLQALMEQYKRTESNTQTQAYVKPHDMPELLPMVSKSLHCLQCDFQTDQESFYKQHLLTHSTLFSVSSYRSSLQGFEGTEDCLNKTINLSPQSIPSVEFNSRVFSDLVEKSHELTTTESNLEDILNKRQEAVNVFKCSVDFCTYETVDEEEIKQHSLGHGLHVLTPERFRCLKCDFETAVELSMKNHVKSHSIEEPKQILEEEPIVQLPKEVYRCNNCDYETNLKAFLKRHMLIHTIKIEIKDEKADKFQCAHCSFETEHEKFLKRHELSHKPNKQFKCQKCDFETLYKRMFAKHVQGHQRKKSKEKAKKGLEEKRVKCNECSYEASSKELLDIHKTIKHSINVHDINLHKCEYCKYQTNWEPCLKRHIEREHPDRKTLIKVKKEKERIEVKTEEPDPPKNNDLFKCDNCDFSSKSKQYLILHLKRSHIKTEEPEKKPKTERKGKGSKTDKNVANKLFECKFRNCTFQTSIKSNYIHHLRKHQSQNPQRILFHFCDLCDFVTKSEEYLSTHKMKMHLNHMRHYKCSQCDFKTMFKHCLKTHSIKHKRYTCNLCDEELESAYALVKHRRSHQVNPKNRIYLCDVCGFQSKNDRSLKMHKKTHNPEFKCPDCPFQTHSKVNFQNHCINHKSADEVTMFPCPHCSYQSRLKRNLAWHMKRHADPSKAQIFKCPSCEYQTFTNAQLKSHLMVHKSKEEVIMLKCDFCTFETKRKSNMVQHRLRHLKDSPDVPLLSCPDCNYTTVAKRHLNKHRKTHNVNPDKMFQCTYCPYKIHRKVYLMRHMENHKTVETFGNDQWQRYTFPPQPQIPITGVTVVPNLGQNSPQNLGHSFM